MNKSELTHKLAERAHLSKAEAARVIDTLFSAEAGIIPGVLKSGEKVQITGFGVFEPRKRKAREGYNPRTGKRMGIKESTSAVFRVGKGLRESLT